MQTEFHRVLGLPLDTDDGAVRAAFRRLAKELHPDSRPDPAAEQRFKAVTEAYEALKTEERRAAYRARHRLHALRADRQGELRHMIGIAALASAIIVPVAASIWLAILLPGDGGGFLAGMRSRLMPETASRAAPATVPLRTDLRTAEARVSAASGTAAIAARDALRAELEASSAAELRAYLAMPNASEPVFAQQVLARRGADAPARPAGMGST